MKNNNNKKTISKKFLIKTIETVLKNETKKVLRSKQKL